jgi:hypothetical protein
MGKSRTFARETGHITLEGHMVCEIEWIDPIKSEKIWNGGGSN